MPKQFATATVERGKEEDHVKDGQTRLRSVYICSGDKKLAGNGQRPSVIEEDSVGRQSTGWLYCVRLVEGEEEEEEEETFRIILGIDVVAFVAHYLVGFCCYATNISVLKMYVIVLIVPASCLRNLLL
jgi:hypothetical protein